MYVLPILIFAPLYNSPRFFEFKIVTNSTWNCTGADGLNGSEHSTPLPEAEEDCVEQDVSVDLIVTEFRRDPIYIKVSQTLFL